MIAELTNHLWQSTLFALAAAILASALRTNGAHIRHRVWLVASLKFLVPFAKGYIVIDRVERPTPDRPGAGR